MSLALDLQGDVAALLDDADFGRDATFNSLSAGSYDEDTGAVVKSFAPTSCRVMLLNYSDRVIDGELIRVGDRKAILSARDVADPPKTGDTLVVGATTYNIVAAKMIELAGTNVLFVAQVRLGG